MWLSYNFIQRYLKKIFVTNFPFLNAFTIQPHNSQKFFVYFSYNTFWNILFKYLRRKFCKSVYFLYQQWIATVRIFLKVWTTDSLVFFSEYISRTAILTRISNYLCIEFLFYMFSFYNFIFQRLICKVISIYFLWFDYCLKSQGTKNCKSTESFCLSILTIYRNDLSNFWHVYWCHVYFFFCEIPKSVQVKNGLVYLDWYFMEMG